MTPKSLLCDTCAFIICVAAVQVSLQDVCRASTISATAWKAGASCVLWRPPSQRGQEVEGWEVRC